MKSRPAIVALAVKPAMAAVIVLLAAGCASQRPFSDASIVAERKAYAHCAVYQAFAAPNSDLAPLDIAQSAVSQCEREEAQVQSRLSEENAEKPGADSFIADYVDELRSTIVSQLAARLAQIRAMRRAIEKTEEPPKGSKRI